MRPMTVKDLIAQLQTIPPDAEVMVVSGDIEAYVYAETVESQDLWRSQKRTGDIYTQCPVDMNGEPWPGLEPFRAVLIR